MKTDINNLALREDYARSAEGESVVCAWDGFHNLCRTGKVRAYYRVGDQLQCKKGDTILTWDIVHIGSLS